MQNGGSHIEDKSKQISDRLLDLGVEIVKLSISSNNNPIGKNISKQLLRAGTSAGTNIEKSCRAESRVDFVHKMQIVLKELKESKYWLRLIKKSQIIKNSNLEIYIDETDQLCSIIAKSVITAKANQ